MTTSRDSATATACWISWAVWIKPEMGFENFFENSTINLIKIWPKVVDIPGLPSLPQILLPLMA
jgi:hypothetical protein